jgi:hypothetical protein
MRKLWVFIVVVSLLAFSFAMAQEVHWANQITMFWDAPTFLADGATPIPPEDVIAYNLYIREPGETVPDRALDPDGYQDFLNNHFVSMTNETSYTFTLNDGIWDVGATALRYIGGTGGPFESVLVWGSEATPPFYVGSGQASDAPHNLRVQ